MKRQKTIGFLNPSPAIRTKSRLIAGACCLLVAIVFSNARRDREESVRTTVELRASEQWFPC